MSASESTDATIDAPAEDATVSAPEPRASATDVDLDSPVGIEPTGEPSGEDAGAGGADPGTSVEQAGDAEGAPTAARWAPEGRGATALTWIDLVEVAAHTAHPLDEAEETRTSDAALLEGAHLRSPFRSVGVMVPVALVLGLVATYATTTLVWPLHAVPPVIEAIEVAPLTAPAAEIVWPVQGSAALGARGFTTTSSTLDASAIASITKVVSSLMVLDRLPLAPGEQGPEFAFSAADERDYWQYRRSDQSALDVPVGGTLTEYQLLQGTLLGSANNYIDRLSAEIWGSDRAFSQAAAVWLHDRGLDGITIINPSGFDEGNVATPAALVALAEVAMSNPVFAEIVGTTSVDLPGAGTVVNTNGMLADAGVIGVKTGTLGSSWNLLTAKSILVGDTTVRAYAAVLSQGDDEQRLAETRALLAQLEAAVQAQEPLLAEGTVVATVSTIWGAPVEVVTSADSTVVLWNGASAASTPDFDFDEQRDAGEDVGTLTTAGPLNSSSVSLRLAADIDEPSPWWRLTHPLELFGLTDAQR